MAAITENHHHDFLNFSASKIVSIFKKTWLKYCIFVDRMNMAKMYLDLSQSNSPKETKSMIKTIGDSHAAKLRLLRRLS